MIESIKWQTTCCAWHGEYAEHPAKDGGVLRLKRGPSVDGYLVMHFDVSGKCHTTDDEGTPEYENFTEEQLLSII
jgi:hypothetical protein